MKKSSIILAIIFLTTIGSYQMLEAQDKTKDDKEKELLMQKAIDQQKKAMAEQEKAQQDAEQNIQLQKEAMDNAMKHIDEARINEKLKVIGERNGRPFSFDMPYVTSGPGWEFTDHGFGGDTERTSWEFSKSVRGTSFSRDYTFDVEPTVGTVVMAVNGDCKSGEIRIKIVMPNGKAYSDILLDEFGNLNWRKSFTISDTENKDKAGAWKFEINSSKATGYFRISLQTY